MTGASGRGPSDAVRNERTKLTAALINGVAVAALGIGILAPAAAALYSEAGLGSAQAARLALVGPAWLGAGVVLHLIARWVLRGLRP